MLRNDPLKAQLSARLEQRSALAAKRFAELDTAIGIFANEMLQRRAALHEGLLSKIVAVEMQKIEGIEDDTIRPRLNRRAQSLKIRGTVAVLDNCLAIDDGRAAAQRRELSRDNDHSSHGRCA